MQFDIQDTYNFYKNACYMLIDRGYNKKDIISDVTIFEKKYLHKSVYIYDDDGRIVVHITKIMKSFVKDIFIKAIMGITNKNIDNILLIIDKKADKTVSNNLIKIKKEKSWISDKDISILHVDRFRFHLTKHNFTDKHELITNYNGDKNLPKIKLNDPFSEWYGAKVGDVFKIYREKRRNTFIDNSNNKNLGLNPFEIMYRIVFKD